jgi:ubiquinone/menaquinone biosynthesis C-methylase UbiE
MVEVMTASEDASPDASQNPWLSISAEDYEAHMGAAGAQQLKFLSEVFKNHLDEVRPETVAVLGCATGNGFEHIQAEVTKLVVGIDINSEYINVARDRFRERSWNLQLFCSDIKNIELEPRSFDLVSCALFFEHVEPSLVVAKALRWLKARGVLSTVIQLPSDTGKSVSDTGIESIKVLEPVTKLVAPDTVTDLAESAGLQLENATTTTLETGKSFRVLTYRMKSQGTGP